MSTDDYTAMKQADYKRQLEAALERAKNEPSRYPKADKEVNHPQVPTARGRLSPEEKARIDAEVRSELDRKWLDVIIPMADAQVRVAFEAELRKIRDERDGHLYRLNQARALLRKHGYVPVTTESGEENWVLPPAAE